LLNTKRVGHIVLFGGTIVLLFYVCSIGIHNVFRYNAFKFEYLDALAKYESEVKKKEWYEFQINAQDRESYWEEKAKMELGYVKNGEVVYKVRTANPGKSE